MSEQAKVNIPDDLVDAHAHYQKYLRSPLRIDDLIERIGRAEAERDQWKEENEATKFLYRQYRHEAKGMFDEHARDEARLEADLAAESAKMERLQNAATQAEEAMASSYESGLDGDNSIYRALCQLRIALGSDDLEVVCD
jgi:hypothetical protein